MCEFIPGLSVLSHWSISVLVPVPHSEWTLCILCFSCQSLSCVWLFVTPWTAAHQASLSITNSQSSLKLMSIELEMPSNHLIVWFPLLLPSTFPSIRVFSNEPFLHIINWALASVLPMNVQDWSPLALTSLISFQSKGPSRVFANTTVQNQKFFSTQFSLWSNSQILTWLLEKL